MRARSTVLALVVALGALSCRDDPGNPARTTGATQEYPFPVVDFTVEPNPGITPGELRFLTQELVELDGVAATESDYDAMTIRVVLAENLDGEERTVVRSFIARHPAVAAVHRR